jgi:hypothetical protein
MQGFAWARRHYLAIGEPYSLPLSDVMDTPTQTFEGANITVVVLFKPWISPHEMEREFRFVAERDRNGQFRWQPQSLE